MSTRSLIGLEEDGKVRYIYCHFDGYIQEGVGEELPKKFTTVEDIKELLSFGNRSSILDYETCDSQYGGEAESSEVCSSIEEYKKDGFDRDTEYAYLFKDGEWYYLETQSWHIDFSKEFKLVKEAL